MTRDLVRLVCLMGFSYDRGGNVLILNRRYAALDD